LKRKKERVINMPSRKRLAREKQGAGKFVGPPKPAMPRAGEPGSKFAGPPSPDQRELERRALERKAIEQGVFIGEPGSKFAGPPRPSAVHAYADTASIAPPLTEKEKQREGFKDRLKKWLGHDRAARAAERSGRLKKKRKGNKHA
jgi:hypothetical protein